VWQFDSFSYEPEPGPEELEEELSRFREIQRYHLSHHTAGQGLM
jgi:hypothetical protein